MEFLLKVCSQLLEKHPSKSGDKSPLLAHPSSDILMAPEKEVLKCFPEQIYLQSM